MNNSLVGLPARLDTRAITVWDCENCGKKVEKYFEEICPHCFAETTKYKAYQKHMAWLVSIGWLLKNDKEDLTGMDYWVSPEGQRIECWPDLEQNE